FHEAWTGQWWWKAQRALPKGAPVAPVILATDKTKLSYFSGDKAAWPVYLTIGNIPKRIRRQPSKRATVLIGYLPVTKLTWFTPQKRSSTGQDLFHSCMREILSPLVSTGESGCKMACADGFERNVYPLLASYMADHPERCLATCTKENGCTCCLVDDQEHGELWMDDDGQIVWSLFRDPDTSAEVIEQALNGDTKAEELAETQGLRIVHQPFWAELPLSNIFVAFPPDLLHQLHKGIFKEHLFSWCQTLMSEKALDQRYKSMPPHRDLRQFKNGISSITQWTGNEFKQMECVFMGAISGGIPAQAAQGAQALLDFIYYSQFPVLNEDDLDHMDRLLGQFHTVKDVFIRHGIRDHFNIPKLHALVHYTQMIRLHGTPDGYNTECPERLHIDYVKKGFRASDKRDYTRQMQTTLSRMEAVDIYQNFVVWLQPNFDNDTEMSDEGIVGEELEKGQTEETSQMEDLDSGNLMEGEVGQAEEHLITKVQQSVVSYPQTPSFPNVPLRIIVQACGAPQFFTCVRAYIRQAHGFGAHLGSLVEHDSFDLFKRATLHLGSPFDPDEEILDTVRATPKRAQGPLSKSASVASFDTVLVHKPEGEQYDLGPPTVAWLKVLFTLPSTIDPKKTQPLLAYIEWFTPFQRKKRDHATLLYKVSKVLDPGSNGYPAATVVPADSIIRSCHFIPIHPKSQGQHWKADTVLDRCKEIYFNEYLDLNTFVAFKVPRS
ncbi:hypothetical protein M407DRAFT_65584, partial [Tulasnella calospora MUT 4182]